MTSPDRLVIDLPAFTWQGPTPPASGSDLIGQIRNGALEPGISRIVVDLRKPVQLKSAFALPAGPASADRVVLDLVVGADGGDAQARTFGTLQSGASRQEENVAGKPFPPAPALPSQTLSPPKGLAVEPPEPPAPVPGRTVTRSGKPLIIIDAGHGGQDPGALSANGKREKDVTLAVARDLKDALEGSGRYRVHLTRSTDSFIKLQDRVAIARKKKGDLFISLHADSIDKPGVSGASIYTLSNKASDAQTAKLAARENRADLIAGVDLSHEDKQVANILIDLAMRDTMNQAKFFANTVVKEARRNGIQMLEKPHRFAGFAVLKAPDIPSVLLEMGFMSNRQEASQLTTPQHRRKIASALVASIDAYFAKISRSASE